MSLFLAPTPCAFPHPDHDAENDQKQTSSFIEIQQPVSSIHSNLLFAFILFIVWQASWLCGFVMSIANTLAALQPCNDLW